MPAILQNAFEWSDVRVFLALWRGRTLSAAASRLGVNASTAGRRLAALEEALGVRLFDRTPDGVLPTHAAEQLVGYAEQLEHAANGLGGAVSGFEAAPEGTVRLTATPAVAENLIAPAIARLRKRYPGLVLEVDASIPYADLARREADVAVRLNRPSSGDLVSVKLADVPSVIAAARPLAKSVGALRALGEAPWLAWEASLGHLPDARWVSAHVPLSAIVMRTNSVGALLRAAEDGAGLLLISTGQARARRLVEVKLTQALRASLSPMPENSLWLVTHRALRQTPRVAAVWGFLLEETARRGLTVRRNGPGREEE
jgi:DNA-binding transcriptional LysR family regulator